MLTRQQLLFRTRCVLVAVAATAGAAGLARALVRGMTGPAWTVEEALVRVCLAALLAVVGWAWLAALSVVVEAWRGRPGRCGAAAPLRRLVLLCCGVALVVPVGAASGEEHPAPRATIAGLPLPDRATGPAHHRALPSARPTPRTVVVRAGDCLWHLSARDLPANASGARVTARWQAIHRLNAAVIGPDPDLIHPGQRLVLPPRPSTGEPRR